MPFVGDGMRTSEEIHEEIERLSEDRTALWHRLAAEHDPDEKIVARARVEERLERAA